MLTNAINRSVLPPAAIFILFLVLGLTADVASAQSLADTTAAQPTFNILPQLDLGGEEDYALPIQLLLLLTVLSLAPAIVVLMTSFTRLIVVFSILRTALGIQQSPPGQVIIGVSLFLTFFMM
ncbi:MAG: hypothetical protein WD205_11905, partial [Rhodothermales bacterium]